MENNENKDLSLNQQISDALQKSEKLNDKIISKEKNITKIEQEITILNQELIQYDEIVADLIRQRIRKNKKQLK